MEDNDQTELQLLPTPNSVPSSSSSSSHMSSRPLDSSSFRYRSSSSTVSDPFENPALDLQLSISVRPIRQTSDCVLAGPICRYDDEVKPETSTTCVEALKWHAAEQIRLAAIEKAYAERVRELTRREMEMAQSEFARARHMWERAREEVEKAERMKERATRQIDSTCMEITCQSCRQRFMS